MAYTFPLKIDLTIPQTDGGFLVYLKTDFDLGYYVDKFDPVNKEAVLGLALYRKGDGSKVRNIGSPMRVTAEPTHGPIANQADIDAALATQEQLQAQINSLQASLSSYEMKKMQMLDGDPNADTSAIDAEIASLTQQIGDLQTQLASVVIPDPQYEWTLDFDTLVAMAPNLQLTTEFIQFALQIRTSLGVRIGDIVDTTGIV